VACPCFEEAFDEIEAMLAKNITSYLETLESYNIAIAGYYIDKHLAE